jgi:hypothetical protein
MSSAPCAGRPMCDAPPSRRKPPPSVRGALDDDTHPPGRLVRLVNSPADGPFTVVEVITGERWGGAFTTRYRLVHVALVLGYRELGFEADAANVFEKPGDNPEPDPVVTGARVEAAGPAFEPLGDFKFAEAGEPKVWTGPAGKVVTLPRRVHRRGGRAS